MKNILKTLVTRKELAAVAMGQIKADKVIKNGNLIDVYTGKIRRADIVAALNRLIAIQGGKDTGRALSAHWRSDDRSTL